MSRTKFSGPLGLGLFLLLAQFMWASDALNFFNNWFVTGDVVVGGVGLRGTGVNGIATGTITISGVPANAEPIAAFLYWSTSEPTTTPSAQNGFFNGYKIHGDVLGNPNSPNLPCYSSGGTLGLPGTAGQSYRADVLRFLPVDNNNHRLANGKQTVKLPDSGGNGNGNLLFTDGASLVVIYRTLVQPQIKPGNANPAPLRAIVIYDGAHSMAKNSPSITQNVLGFYQASGGQAKIVNIAAYGQKGFSTPLTVNGVTLTTSPFVGAQGPRWDNPTNTFTIPANASSFSTMIQAPGNGTQTCVTSVAMIASVVVTDTDLDGLLDIWETQGLHRNTTVSPATFGTCTDPANQGQPCVNLPAMGANPNVQDIFIQVDWMYSDGSNAGNPQHTHIPLLSSLCTVVGTFAMHQINLHFDVGNNYQGPQNVCPNANGQPPPPLPSSFIIPAQYAATRPDPPANLFNINGGISETTMACQGQNCAYPGLPYPVLSFDYGFDSVKLGNSALSPAIPAHFSQDRVWAFRYGLFAHAIGGPYNNQGKPISPFTGQPLQNPQPFSYSGISDLPGGGFMVTFGLWTNDQQPQFNMVGTPAQVAQTLMHEMGHGLGLHHDGLQDQPNCVPNYPSIMNYLYQIRGLTDGRGAEQADYSYGFLPPLDESKLNTNNPPGAQHYRTRFYGPMTGPLKPPQGTMPLTQLPLTAGQAVQAHCDGSPIKPGEAPRFKLENPNVVPSTPDWSNGNSAFGTLISPFDLNNQGTLGQVFTDSNDWANINLQHIGDGDNFGGFSVGSLVSDSGSLLSDAGSLLSDSGSLISDSGSFANTGAVFSPNAGSLISDSGSLLSDAGELDLDTVLLSDLPGPTNLATTNTATSIVLTWTPPSGVGSSLTYNIYRCPGTSCTPTLFTQITPGGPGTGTPSAPSFTDPLTTFSGTTQYGGTACPSGNTCPNTPYVYAVTAVATVNTTKVESPFSNTGNSEVTELFVVVDSNSVYNNDNLFTYDGSSHPAVYHVFGDIGFAQPNSFTPGQLAGVTCISYRNAGTYTNPCPSASSYSGTDLVAIVASSGTTYSTYVDGAGMHIGGALIINQRPITVTAASSKVYDGNTTCPYPACTSGPNVTWSGMGSAIASGDQAQFTESFDNPNVGTTHKVTPTGIVNDSGSPLGSNYSYTFVSINTGVIMTRQLTASLAASNKVYDTTNTEPNNNMSCSLTNVVTGDTVTCSPSNGTFNSNQASLATTVSATATLGGASATNYTFGTPGTNQNSVAPVTTSANITTLPVTATLSSAPSKTYDGTATETNPMTCSVATVLSPDVLTCTATNGTFNTSQVTANLVTATATITGMAASNYTFGTGGTTAGVTSTSVSLASSITTRQVTATLNAQNRPYDGTTIEPTTKMSCSLGNAVDNNVTCTPSNGTFNSSQVVGATTVNATATLGGSTAADYTFGAAGSAVNSVPVAANPVSITPAPLTITASSAAIIYGAPPVGISAGYSGFVPGENANSLTTQPMCSSAYVQGNPGGIVGSYASSCLGAVDSNYNISYAVGMVTVSQALLTVTPIAVNKSFDGTTSVTVTWSDNRLNSDQIAEAFTGASFANIGPGNSITVNVTGISISGPGASNYMLASTTATTQANITDNIDLSALSLNGVNYGSNTPALPIWNAPVLTLTNSTTETASAWLNTAIPVSAAFSTTFKFQITPSENGPGSIGDGFAFVIQSAPSPTAGSPWSFSGNTTLGTTGQGGFIGYAGIPNSIAIEFDTYPDTGSPFNDPACTTTCAHIGIQSNGASPNSAYHQTGATVAAPQIFAFADGAMHTAKITYDGTSTLSVYVDGGLVVTGTLPSPLGQFLGLSSGTAYVGFTAATGAAQEADIVGPSWTWDYQ